MTQTAQHRSLVSLNNADRSLTINNPEREDNMSLLLSVLDSMNNLCEKLNRLDYVLKRKNIELNIYRQNKGV